MNFDDPRAILRMLEQNARRRFGQHFLTRKDIVQRMVRRAGVSEGDEVVEIGPGLGILTDALQQKGTKITAVELDRDLADHIERVFPDVRLIRGDALKQDWPELLGAGPVTVVANLPYNVGTKLVMRLLRHPTLFKRIVVMLQKEVVDRMLADPGSKTYGALSVQVQVRARASFMVAVPPTSFHPAPKVHSSVIRLDPYPTAQTGSVTLAEFDRVVRAGFSQRRKVLPNSLGPLYGKDVAVRALEALDIDPGVRAERLTVQQWRDLAAQLHPSEADNAELS
ncbi:MAG: 16S rRNA (adenine1518-N6/adenine1519-N6)-dimethyltransferase [Kiritimatiellia bacterium]|jgi:16S rRNA (adenine1518-N6/adenine1519-N6)-dimethyltransferase